MLKPLYLQKFSSTSWFSLEIGYTRFIRELATGLNKPQQSSITAPIKFYLRPQIYDCLLLELYREMRKPRKGN